VRGRWPWIFAVVWCVAGSAIAHGAAAAVTEVDVRAEIAAALFAASATQAAAERVADAKIRSQRKEIEELRGKVRSGDAQRKAELTAAEEKYVAALAERDRAYAQEIAVFRKAVEDIAFEFNAFYLRFSLQLAFNTTVSPLLITTPIPYPLLFHKLNGNPVVPSSIACG
jgi:hypothetical protein